MSPDAVALWTEQSSDPELIAGVRAGDTAAFGVLYERHVAAARKVAHMYTNSAADVDDVISESFSRVLRALQRGDGPDLAFRAYLFTIVRRTGMDLINKGIRTKPREDMAEYESALGYEPSSDEPTLDGFEHSLVADAFRSLPERWQAVLWYTEVEKKAPKDIAPILGLSANGVAALAYRAREALRQAYLQQHLGSTTEVDCVAANQQLGAYVRGGLSTREYGRINQHVTLCARCSALVVELEDVNRGMRAVIAPLILGAVGVGALEGGLPIGGALASGIVAPGDASGLSGTDGLAADGATYSATAGGVPVDPASTSSGGSSNSGSTSGSASTGGGAASGVGAGLAGVAAAALPVVAVVGVVALAVAAAAWMGLFSPASPDGSADPVAQEPTTEPSDSTVPQQEGDSDTVTPRPDLDPETDAPTDAMPQGSGSSPTTPTPDRTGPSAPGTANPGGTDNPGHGGNPGSTPEPKPGTTTPPLPQAMLEMKAIPLGFLAIPANAPAVPLTVTNSGTEASGSVTATVSLPEGLIFAVPRAGGTGMSAGSPLVAHMRFSLANIVEWGAWTCTLSANLRDATCTTPSIGASQTSHVELPVQVALAPGQTLASDAVTRYIINWGNSHTSYEVPTGVTAVQENFSHSYSGSGHLAVAHFGAPLVSCPVESTFNGTTCADAVSYTGASGNNRYNNNSWAMMPLNDAGGVHNSATTSVALPAGARVVYAGLEWSANRLASDNGFTHEVTSARFRVPDGNYAAVVASEVTYNNANASSATQYVARADVTELVSAAGSGDYALADIALAATNTGSGSYAAGFALTVVYELDTLPASHVTVFTGFESVRQGTSPTFTLAAGGPALVTVGMVAWDGDRGTSGDRATLNPAGGQSVDLLPALWDGTQVIGWGLGSNALASTAVGSRFANTLGTDAVTFQPTPVGRGLSTVTFSTSSDVYLVSTFSVTVALQP